MANCDNCANIVLNKSKSAIPLLFNGPEVLPSADDKAKLFVKNISKNFNLDELGISLTVFPSRINLKLHIFITAKMVKKVKKNLDSSKVSGPDSISLVVLKNYESELSYLPAELFNMCLKSVVFQIVGRSHWWSLLLM